jgi:putative addiction module component (TIGR02574 family)
MRLSTISLQLSCLAVRNRRPVSWRDPEIESRAFKGHDPWMSKAEILAELPRLTPEDRAEILNRLWDMEERGPTEHEKAVLNEAQAAYDADSSPGTPWREVEARMRKRP